MDYKIPQNIMWPESGDELDSFVSPVSSKTKPMVVVATDFDGDVIDQFHAPAGFQLDRWAQWAYEGYNVSLSMKFRDGSFEVAIYPSGNRHLLYKYTGSYEE